MTYALPPFTLHRPGSVDEALALAAEHEGALFLAGGTDLMVNLRKRLHEPAHVIDIKGLQELGTITREKDQLLLGAGVTLNTLAGDPLVREHLPILAESAGLVAGPTLRGMGTLGGNLCLDTRCRYYNQSYFWRSANDFCLKKDGTVCHVAPGGTFCWAAFSGDTAPALLVLDAEVELVGPKGQRTIPLTQFYGKDGRWSVGTEPGGKEPGELMVRVRVPLPGKTPPGKAWDGVYEKLRVRESIDYPLVGLALTGVRMALTAVAPRPLLVPGLEPLVGKPMSLETVDHLQRAGNKAGKPMRTSVADPAYRRTMIGALIEKAVARLEPGLSEALAERHTLE